MLARQYAFTLPEATEGIVARMLQKGLERPPEGALHNRTELSWRHSDITDAHFPPTAARWGRTVVPGFLTCTESVLPGWSIPLLQASGVRPAEGGELIALVCQHPELAMRGKLVAPGQYWRDPNSTANLMVCAGPHDPLLSIFLGVENAPCRAGTTFVGIHDWSGAHHEAQ